MDPRRIAERLAVETDDVLATISVVDGDLLLTDHLFAQLVDLLLEGMLVELRRRLQSGELSPMDFCIERAELVGQCEAVGLMTPR